MSEKVTFKELIESIAEETENSKQFTHDFLKDFVDVINDGLKEDRSVNIAGFGKFDLKKIDEREGYNPQTEEKITIPAHNKIVFKPYKDLRELVNAPYAHLEPKLIEPEENTSDTEEEAQPTDISEEDDFIPMAPPTSHDTLDDKQSNTADSEKGKEKTFDPDKSEAKISSSFIFEEEKEISEDEEDIVEYNRDTPEENLDEAFEKLFGDDDDSEETAQEGNTRESLQEKERNTEPKESEAENDTSLEENAEDGTQIHKNSDSVKAGNSKQKRNQREKQLPPNPASSSASDKEQQLEKEGSLIPILAISTIIILLIAVGAWYLGLFSGYKSYSTLTDTTISATKMPGRKTVSSSAKGKKSTQKRPINKQQQNKATKTIQPKQRKDEQIIISKGQTLWSIAQNKYNDPRLWPWIYHHNNSLDNPDLIIAGNSLSVPLPSGPKYGLTSADSVEVAKGYIATYQWYKENGSSQAKNYLWVAKRYHSDLRDIAHFKIDKDDLAFASQAR